MTGPFALSLPYNPRAMPSPSYAHKLFDEAVALARAGRRERAVDLFRKALRADGSPAAHSHVAIALIQLGQTEAAEQILRDAVARLGDDARLLNDLAALLMQRGRGEEAIPYLERSVAHAPAGFSAPMHNLAHLLQQINRPDEAESLLRRAVATDPANADAWQALANVRRDLGAIDDALACLESAIRLRPNHMSAHHALLFSTLFHDAISWRDVIARHARWAARFADPLTSAAPAHANDRSPFRKLRVGYIGPLFAGHVISRLLEPVLAKHDRAAFETYAYCNSPESASHKAQLAPHCDRWRQCESMSDEQLAMRIGGDAIDILIDVNGHMASSRLLALARKPAPIQINWLAYPATFGMRALDYRITCAGLDPIGTDESAGEPERLIRLPDTFWCYPTNHKAPIDASPPSARNGFITFGCLNAFVKARDACLRTWARVLDATPRSTLMILVQGGEGARSVLGRIKAMGIDPQRVILNGYVSREAHLARFNEIDVFLDSFPYGGHVTTHDALWMGVPVIAMAGRSPIARAGATILGQVGLSENVATDSDGYVSRAIELANDELRRAELRAGLRTRMQASPLTDAARFTLHLEAGYRAAWTRWCSAQPPADIDVPTAV